MQVWNLLHVARWKHRTQKSRQICHLGTIAQLCRAIFSQLRHVSTIGKKLVKQQYVLHMSPQYGELRPTSDWDRSGSLRHPSKFQRVSRLGSITARCLVVGVSQTLRCFTDGATYVWQGDHDVGHWIGPHSCFNCCKRIEVCWLLKVTDVHLCSIVSVVFVLSQLCSCHDTARRGRVWNNTRCNYFTQFSVIV